MSDCCLSCQGFLAEGLQRTSAGLGSVIIDSQPLTVAVLAALLFGEKLTSASYAGLGLGVLGLILLEVPVDILTTLPQQALGESSHRHLVGCCCTPDTCFSKDVLEGCIGRQLLSQYQFLMSHSITQSIK